MYKDVLVVAAVYRSVRKALFLFGQTVFLLNMRPDPGEGPIDHPGG
jgi:hypothetical protein